MVVYYTDTKATKIVKSDLSLADYVIPVGVTFAGTVDVGSVDQGAPATSNPWIVSDANDVSTGTTAPSKIGIVGGKTADGTPAYNPLPLAAGGGSLIISGAVTADTELPAAVALNGTIVKSVSAPMVGAGIMFSDGTNLVEIDSAHPLPVDNLSDVAAGTTAPSKVDVVGGTSNDGTPQYQPLPLGASGRSVITEPYVGSNTIKTNTFSVVDSLTRPANVTAYSAQQSINCNNAVTALVSISGNTVTLTVANALVVGDYFTIVGVDGNFTNGLNIDGNWKAKTGTNATTLVFDTFLTPTGTPATSSHGTVAKLLAFDVAGVNGGGVILSEVKVSLPGIGMTGAIRVYIYNGQIPVLVDQSTFTVLVANGSYRRDEYDIYPVTEGAGSDTCMGTIRLWEVIKCDPADTHLFVRLCSEGAGTPTSSGSVTVRLSGIQLGG
jgi:hypothetical protein